LKALRTLRAHLPASIPLIGCGGISTGADALEFAKAGASLVQVYTSFGYDGVGACRRIKDELSELLTKNGTTWQAVVDQAVRDLAYKEPSSPKEPSASEGSVHILIEEAKELGRLLDEFGKGHAADVPTALTIPPPAT
jgi:dihydroorotate dehydrogenase